MRLYFHLTNGSDVIRDDDGIEVADLEDAHRELCAVVTELRQLGDFQTDDWTGWRFEVTDTSGVIVAWCGLTLH